MTRNISALREEFRRTDKPDTQSWKVLTVWYCVTTPDGLLKLGHFEFIDDNITTSITQ